MKPAKIECQLVLQHTNFIMQNHRVHQTSLMPGATFLDIVFRILAAQGMDCERAELRNIMFPEAIATYPGHDRRIVVSLDPGQDGAWQVRGKSQWADVFDDVWKENFRAELHFVNPPTDPQIDVAALKKQAIRLRDNEEVYRIARSEQIVHGPAMKCFGKMYQGRDYLLAELALDENSRTSDVEFYIHPAKLDSSTLLAYAFTEFDPGQPFIPVFIGSFRAPRPAHGACYVYISEPEVLAPSGDVIYNSYYLCNDAGEVLAYFGKLACKCIRHAGLIQRLVADALPKPEADFATALVAVSLASSTVTEAVRAPTATLDSTRAVAPNAMSARQGDALAIIMDILETMVADALGVKRAAVDAQAGFYQLGLESVMMLQMAEALEKVVGVALYPTLLFEFSNISSLAQYLAAQFGAQILANADASTLANAQSSSSAMAAVEPAASGLLSFVLDLIAKRLNLSPQQIAQGRGCYALGLESVDMLQMSEQLEQFVGKTLYPTLLFEFSDIASLVAHLEQQYGPFAPLAGRAATSTPTAASVFDSSVVATTATLAQQPAPAAGMGLSALGNGQQTSTQASDNTRHETAQLQAYQRVWQTCAALPPVQQLPSLAVLGAAPDLLDEFRLMYATQISDLIEVTHNASLRSSGQRELQADLAQGEGLQAVARHLAHSKTPARHVVWVVSPSQSAEQVLMGVTALLQALVGAQINPRVALVVQGEGAAEDARFYALAAMARTVALEMPGLWCRAVALLDGDAAHRIVRELLDEQRECAVKLAGCTRQLLRFSRLPASVASGSTWRKGGKYLIAGGAGGIGWQLAQYLARQHGASVMLLGRSPQNSSIAARLATWHASGEDIHYLQADVTDAAEVQAAVAATRERFGAIHGVIHAAGVVRDALFFRKQSSDMLAVLGPKLIGARNLDQCTAKDDLDCFILFSSVSASIANIGQSDYAFANAWLEAFAAERQARSERPGKTLAIGWPYWEQGGMNVHDKVVVQGIKSHGLYPMPTAVGLAALDALLASNVPAVTVSYAVAERFERVLAMQEAAKLPVAGLPSSERAVAIIGLAGRYPDAENMDQFWHNLANGHDSVRDVPLERWDHAAIFDARRGVAGKTYGAKGGFIDRVSGFDAPFFGISRKEAELMDPQERLFLMTCWHTLEDAGYAASDVADTRTGVFAGVMWNHYQQVRSSHDSALPTALHASVANRVSFCLNLHGPSLTLDTMCSSSLSALHLAAESVRRGECDLALAGGVNLALHPNKYLQLAENHFLSDDGLCRSFGKGGTGYVPGEGVGAVLLKPLDQALADGDHVYAVLRASSMNHSGKTSGYTVPSPVAQSSLLRATWQRAALNPKQLGYIEAHGTGTTLGDPIEVDGIRLALEDAGVARQAIAIGSVKSNIGHLESAAGIAGVSKVLLQMQHKQLAPSLHTAELNPHIDFSRAPVRVQRELGAWPANRDGSARVAGVSAFGAGGSNVHVLLEEYPAPDPLHDWHESQLFVLSAKDAKALHAYAQRFVAWLDQRSEDEIDHGGLQRATLIERIAGLLGVAQQEVDCQTSFGDMGLDVVGLSQVFGDAMPQQGIALDSCIDDCVADSVHDQANLALPSLCDLAYTMQTGRMAMPERLAIVVSGKAQLRATLQAFIDDQARPPHAFWGKPAAVISRPASSSELLFQQGEWRLLASLWQAGADVPWRQCYQASRVPARRVSLPLYPFAQESYWLGGYKASLAHAGTGPLVDIATVRASASASVPAVSSEPMSASAQASASVPRPASASAPDQSDLLVLVQVFVEGCLCKVLYLGEGELDAKQSFNDLGLSSTGALELIEDINQHFGLTLEVVVIYDHPCLEDLTRHICTCTALDVTMQSALLQAKPASVAGNSTGSSQPTNTGIAPTDIRSLATTSPTLATSATLSAGASNAPSVVEQASEPVSTNSPRGAIAVIGMSGRFPDAPDLDAFWHNLQRGHCSARQVDDARWDSANYYDADGRAPGKTNARTAALLDQVDRFDAGVFNISPLAAQLMDPQQRIFLEQAWAALEDAGYGGSNVEKTHCGVYVGCAVGDYIEWIEAAGQENTGEAFLGVVPSILAARISYRLNLSGPALAVDTACSSSLVAIHLACESIRSGECDMALAGGVALMLTPQLQVRSGKMGILSVNGRCAPFDVNANGTVMGEGVGVLVLKDLARAKADGDTIHGVIYASGMNSDGKTNGITAPSADAQEQLVRQVLRQARLQPSDLGYVEAHGTGTYLGDPIEVNALKRVFGPLDGRGKHCGLGSVKSNIGHTTLAAGVASVIKLLLGLRAGQLPPSLNFTELNPKIDLQDSPLFVQTGLSDWQAGPDGRRLAGVSSFGFSGTNCHLVLGMRQSKGGIICLVAIRPMLLATCVARWPPCRNRSCCPVVTAPRWCVAWPMYAPTLHATPSIMRPWPIWPIPWRPGVPILAGAWGWSLPPRINCSRR
jgi:acyl transferase domain-containing protein